jgi:hypothetical protein
MVSPEAALLTASRKVGQLLLVQLALLIDAGSPVPVTVHVVVAAYTGNAASPIHAKTPEHMSQFASTRILPP